METTQPSQMIKSNRTSQTIQYDNTSIEGRRKALEDVSYYFGIFDRQDPREAGKQLYDVFKSIVNNGQYYRNDNFFVYDIDDKETELVNDAEGLSQYRRGFLTVLGIVGIQGFPAQVLFDSLFEGKLDPDFIFKEPNEIVLLP
jgi:hypothetical protein